MIEHLFLHIGHHKTGTSSLQQTCRANAPRLAQHGIFYFASHRNHHAVARGMDPAACTRDEARINETFFREAAATTGLTRWLAYAEPRRTPTKAVILRRGGKRGPKNRPPGGL